MTDDPKCEAGCVSYYGGEKKHHRDCPYYPESLTKLNADRIEALRAERNALEAENRRLRDAGQAIVDRWDTPWKYAEATAHVIDRLRAALKGDNHE